MGNPVIASLEENLKYIKLIAEPTHSSFTKDKRSTGKIKELTVQEFISSYLTNDYQIKKGSIFSKNYTSNNIDCVVLFPNHPKLKTPTREVIIAEGVFTAIEVKPNISVLTEESEFHRGLKQIQSVKKIERKRVISGLIDTSQIYASPYFNKIPCIIFSFKSQKIQSIIKYLRKVIKEKIVTDEELPDIIISIDKGILFYCPHIQETFFKNFLDFHYGPNYPSKVFVEISEKGSKQLIWFLRLFLSLPKPSFAFNSSILNEYLEIKGDAFIKFHALNPLEGFTHKYSRPKNQI